jgi:hypothetical protein
MYLFSDQLTDYVKDSSVLRKFTSVSYLLEIPASIELRRGSYVIDHPRLSLSLESKIFMISEQDASYIYHAIFLTYNRGMFSFVHANNTDYNITDFPILSKFIKPKSLYAKLLPVNHKGGVWHMELPDFISNEVVRNVTGYTGMGEW